VYVGCLALRVVIWNLKHGRAEPPAGRDLFDEFAGALAGWDWDAALLQEVPPWWPARLVPRAEHRLVLTSRNALLPLRRAIATRWPDAIKSNGGGCNAILVRGRRILDHRTRRLCWLPERRWLHAVRLEDGVWVGNLHATVHNSAGAIREGRSAAQTLRDWALGAPAVLGGDFNVRELSLPEFERVAGHDVDQVFVSRLDRLGQAEVLDHGALSDHAPLTVTLMPAEQPESEPAPRSR
jgi:endonuclease/exonuclease/phosphatase family metal-dependent hydrolase